MTELEELQMQHREQAAEKREKAKARKARTHRLIQRGAIFEAALKDIADPERFSNEQIELIVCFALSEENVIRYIQKVSEEG